MTKLEKLLRKRIEATGPISLADYMAECLMHPKHGYYQQERVFGKDGDFITAPEISQMFGEMIGLWLADRWVSMGSPNPVHLVELGPGRGTLMEDILRTGKKIPGFNKAAQVHFIETSAQLRAQQKEKVPLAKWHDDISCLPSGATLFIANEFFDALPIHQFEKREEKWHERAVGVIDDALGFVLTQPSPQFALVSDRLLSAPEGSILEVCPAAISICATIAAHLANHGGAALFIDYGYARSAPADTFQALKAHTYVNPFSEPGKADLTAHVAFDRLAQSAGGAGTNAFGAIDQGQFLMNIGIGNRAQQLANDINPESQQRILSELKRLTAPEEMGTLFKVLALQPPRMPAPPGF